VQSCFLHAGSHFYGTTFKVLALFCCFVRTENCLLQIIILPLDLDELCSKRWSQRKLLLLPVYRGCCWSQWNLNAFSSKWKFSIPTANHGTARTWLVRSQTNSQSSIYNRTVIDWKLSGGRGLSRCTVSVFTISL